MFVVDGEAKTMFSRMHHQHARTLFDYQTGKSTIDRRMSELENAS
jgi:hypothetical protein